MATLSPRQWRFVNAVNAGKTALAAAIEAGYRRNSAQQQATKLLQHPEIARILEETRRRREERTEINADTVLRETLRLATCDLAQAFDSNGDLLPPHKMPEDCRRAIASIEVHVGDDGVAVKKIKFWDKTRNLELLGKHLKLFVDRVEVSGPSLAELIDAAKKTPGGE